MAKISELSVNQLKSALYRYGKELELSKDEEKSKKLRLLLRQLELEIRRRESHGGEEANIKRKIERTAPATQTSKRRPATSISDRIKLQEEKSRQTKANGLNKEGGRAPLWVCNLLTLSACILGFPGLYLILDYFFFEKLPWINSYWLYLVLLGAGLGKTSAYLSMQEMDVEVPTGEVRI